MPEACFQHDGRELRLCSSRVTSGRSIFRTRWYPARPPEMRPTNETGKVRSRLLDVMDREANAHTVDVRSCRRHASSMIGFVPVEVVSRWSGSCRRRASQRYTLLNSLRCWAVAGAAEAASLQDTASLLRPPDSDTRTPSRRAAIPSCVSRAHDDIPSSTAVRSAAKRAPIPPLSAKDNG